ncbi:hypothetical protein NKI48_34025 [Mesorhizobium sp. M0644]|uniref:hypothetical protein n=1 Tax=Mesorhizobium sp. M0644 TaxID=2956979 RepID=UPI003337B44E
MAKDIHAQEQIRLERVIKKLIAVIAELEELRDAPMWPNQMDALKKAVFDLEERMSNDRGLFHQPSNR